MSEGLIARGHWDESLYTSEDYLFERIWCWKARNFLMKPGKYHRWLIWGHSNNLCYELRYQFESNSWHSEILFETHWVSIITSARNRSKYERLQMFVQWLSPLIIKNHNNSFIHCNKTRGTKWSPGNKLDLLLRYTIWNLNVVFIPH